jgi:hypothetical protein
VSTTPIRRAQAAEQVAAVQAAAEARRTDTHSHQGRPGHHGVGQRGQFGGYVFRAGRAPAAAVPRRPAPLRRRPPPPPGANQAGMEHDADHGLMLNMPLLPQSSAAEDELRAAGMEVDAMDGHQDPGEGMPEHESRQRQLALQWRAGSRARPDDDSALIAGLRAACGGGAQALWASAAPNVAVRADDLMRALVGALVAANAPAQPQPPGPGPTTLQLAAVRAYLMKVQETGVERGPLATLARVKHALLENRGHASQRSACATPDEGQQNRNLLLPLKLLNADRPRTAAQAQQACSRIELSCQTALMVGTVASGA